MDSIHHNTICSIHIECVQHFIISSVFHQKLNKISNYQSHCCRKRYSLERILWFWLRNCIQASSISCLLCLLFERQRFFHRQFKILNHNNPRWTWCNFMMLQAVIGEQCSQIKHGMLAFNLSPL